jgi:hypothetical protein
MNRSFWALVFSIVVGVGGLYAWVSSSVSRKYELQIAAQKSQAAALYAQAQASAAQADAHASAVVSEVNQRSSKNESTIDILRGRLAAATSRLRQPNGRWAGSACAMSQAVASSPDRAGSAAFPGGLLSSEPVEPTGGDGYAELAELAASQALEADRLNNAYESCRVMILSERL